MSALQTPIQNACKKMHEVIVEIASKFLNLNYLWLGASLKLRYEIACVIAWLNC
jgi:hypothetical protein